tara:strand:- start:234 stop:761 length:528 start_codon:yes stop_codon:yes gene_type:complete
MALQLKILIDNKKIEKILVHAKKTIDGNIILFGHPDIDIIIMPSKSKVICMPKDELDDELYDTQKRMFRFLVKKGVVDPMSVQAGNIFMSQEASIPEVVGDGDKIQFLLYAISNFLDEEQPFYDDQEEYEKEFEQNLLEPEPDEYTELDPRRHNIQKGSLPPARPSYGINTIYRI